jgi:hypothetical protein
MAADALHLISPERAKNESVPLSSPLHNSGTVSEKKPSKSAAEKLDGGACSLLRTRLC